MTIDPMLSLSFSMSASPGAYALLLGSGISRSAQIPTGWEITLELVRRIAVANGSEEPTNPDQWYQEKFGTDPSYSELLDQLAKTRSDRSAFLQPYFEPTEDDRAQNIKMPSRAHRAIANMVSNGHVRVIVTTNFDRLLEQALEDVSIRSVVISNGDQAMGAPPLVHASCVILKVNGDYLDSRIRNTEQELATYEQPVDALLDQILDEFGLIVCGWSGDWDIALRDAIMRCPSRRYMTYWAARGSLGQRGSEIVTQRGGISLQIQDADSFFESLEEKINALDQFKRPHPLSTAVLIESLKKYIVDEASRIRLHDLLVQVTDRTLDELAIELGDEFLNLPLDEAGIESCLKRIDGICTDLTAAFATIGRWGSQSHIQWLRDSIVKIASIGAGPQGGYDVNLSIRHVPTLYMIYACGLALIKAGNYGAIESIVNVPISLPVGQKVPLLSINPHLAILRSKLLTKLPDFKNKITPLSDYLYSQSRGSLKPLVVNEEDYDSIFDRLELLLSMIYIRNRLDEGRDESWTIPGRWVWKDRFSQGNGPFDILLGEFTSFGIHWQPFNSGFFDGNPVRVHEVIVPLTAFYQTWRQRS
ncbi:SIR2 family protein [Synechococcus sp. CCY 0621]|uniref:SIR2 family protein n=1 Tax=Synechococcus sp. CCY 0621 TaxID=2815603 RepID=UPI001C244C65|nr:SIR2 family protein [Synechococcus sp. CCY 0621]